MPRRGEESPFQIKVMSWAELNGWLAYHPPENLLATSRSGRTYRQAIRRGFFDVTLVHPTLARIVFAELKSSTGRVRPDQVVWAEAVDRVRHRLIAETGSSPVERYLWRPADWPEIEEVLRYEHR